MNGTTTTTFEPESNLTRAQTAMVLWRIAGQPAPTAKAPFTDLVDAWYRDAIAWAAEQKVVNGRGDGTFDPDGQLTGYEWAKMLLCALGYDTKVEQFVGNSWAINVAKYALRSDIDLFEGNKGKDYNAAATREEATLYAFNTLKATMVDYENKITANVNGAEVTISNTTAYPVTWSEGINNDGNINDDGFVQFAEEFFPDLTRTDDSTIFTHGEIETELDRRLLVREGMTPLRADVTSHVKNTSMTRLAASRVLSESRETVGECIMSFKAAMRTFVNSGEFAKTLICLGLRAAGHYDQVHGMLMRRRPVRGLKTVADYLELEFYKTVPFGVRMVTELYRALEEGTELPREYKGNFEGTVFGKGPVRW